MLTLFSIPKPFRGHDAVIQRNAIRSWTLLGPGCEVVLLGDDEGTAEAAREFGVRHLPQVARNAHGTPLVSSIFSAGEGASAHAVCCYVNADMLLLDDFLPSVERVAGRFRRFLMIGQRWNLSVREPLDFAPGWQQQLRAAVAAQGRLYRATGMDYFVFSKGLWDAIPPFAIGRTAWDNWLVYGARARGAALIDATPAVLAVHQDHDYTHHPDGAAGVWKGQEAKENLELAGSLSHLFTVKDTRLVLTASGVAWRLDRWRLWRWLRTWPVLSRWMPQPLRRGLLALFERRHRRSAALRGLASPAGG